MNGGSFPSSISEIIIDENNPKYTIYNGNICSKDKKILYVCINKNETINVDTTIEIVESGAFSICKNAKNIIFSDELKKLNGTVFQGSYATSIKIGKGLQNIHQEAFRNATHIINIEISAENPNYVAENGAIYNKDKTKLIKLVNNDVEEFSIPNTVNRIEHRGCGEKHKLRKVEIPNSVKNIDTRAFEHCQKLTTIYIPESVETMGTNIFDGCDSLTEVRINKEKGSIEGSPWGCMIGERAIKWLK